MAVSPARIRGFASVFSEFAYIKALLWVGGGVERKSSLSLAVLISPCENGSVVTKRTTKWH